MKSWKKRWKNELEKITPPLRKDVVEAPIPKEENVEYNGGNTAIKSLNYKKTLPVIASFIAIIICVVTLCLFLIKPSEQNSDFVFTLEINPAVTFSADGSGTVTGIIASNADADIILSDGAQDEIKRKKLDYAVTYYADRAAKLGYIDFDRVGSAVRISGYGGDNLLSEAQISLENYFAEKGVFAVVVAESVEKEEFLLRSGLSENLSDDEILSIIKDGDALFSDREAEGMNLLQLQSLYTEIAVEGKLFNYINDSLSENLERIIKNAEDIKNLSQLYYDIFNHDDNPLKPFGDYWTVKALNQKPVSESFAALMEEMESALDNYRNVYGTEITNIAQLSDAVSSYLKVPVDTLATLLENLSFEKFETISQDVAKIMEVTGLASEGFTKFLQAPQSVEDYFEKMSSLINSEYRERLESYKNLYNKNRQPLSRADYENYVEDIVKEYGSLSAYWQEIKN